MCIRTGRRAPLGVLLGVGNASRFHCSCPASDPADAAAVRQVDEPCELLSGRSPCPRLGQGEAGGQQRHRQGQKRELRGRTRYMALSSTGVSQLDPLRSCCTQWPVAAGGQEISVTVSAARTVLDCVVEHGEELEPPLDSPVVVPAFAITFRRLAVRDGAELRVPKVASKTLEWTRQCFLPFHVSSCRRRQM